MKRPCGNHELVLIDSPFVILVYGAIAVILAILLAAEDLRGVQDPVASGFQRHLETEGHGCGNGRSHGGRRRSARSRGAGSYIAGRGARRGRSAGRSWRRSG